MKTFARLALRSSVVAVALVASSVGSLVAYLIPATAHDAQPPAISLADDALDSELAVPNPFDVLDELGTNATDPVVDEAWKEVAPASGAGDGAVIQLPAPVSGTRDNPFSNTCDGRAIGFLGPSGDRPRLAFRDVPAGAVLECRTGPEAAFAKLTFRPCDGGKGDQPVHQPQLAAEGKHRTEARYRIGNAVGPTMQTTYYIHRSLDRVACCQAAFPDTAWFDATRASLPAAGPFGASTRIDNPEIAIAVQTKSGPAVGRLLSLRRTFRFSDDRRLLLIRRTMASRRRLERTKTTSCVGLEVSIPKVGVDKLNTPDCPRERESPFRGRGALIPPKCPGIYCTVTSCQSTQPGCIQVTHTFNRGPGQKPWIKKEPEVCANRSTIAFNSLQCDAYVLNGAGDAVCLAGDAGKVRVVSRIADVPALGLTVLGEQRSGGSAGDRYVFSAKTTSMRPARNVLNLPR
jgi:hypothetical protein